MSNFLGYYRWIVVKIYFSFIMYFTTQQCIFIGFNSKFKISLRSEFIQSLRRKQDVQKLDFKQSIFYGEGKIWSRCRYHLECSKIQFVIQLILENHLKGCIFSSILESYQILNFVWPVDNRIDTISFRCSSFIIWIIGSYRFIALFIYK